MKAIILPSKIAALNLTFPVGSCMFRRTPRSRQAGLSLVEMVMTLAVGLVMASVALPIVVGAVQRYRLNGATQQVANLMDLTRYTAIRQNKVFTLEQTTQNGRTVLYIHANNDATLGPNNPMMVLPGDMQVANSDPLTPSSSSMGLGPTSNFQNSINFDYRGTVLFAPGAQVNPIFLAIGYTNQAQYGIRAVTLTPMGQTKTWAAPPNGTWSGM